MEFKELKEFMDNIFTEVIGVIDQLVEINENQIKSIVSSYDTFDKKVGLFLKEFYNEFKKTKDTLFAKRSDVSIEKLKESIETATNKFVEIADDLEILSLNTICKTKKLGKERAVIFHISDEIKKNSDHAKFILSKIKYNFYSIYERFLHIVTSFENLKNIKLEKSLNLEEIYNIKMIADLSDILQYTQFHDIFKQQLEEIENKFLLIDWNNDSLYELGKKKKFLQQTLDILEGMKKDVDDVLNNIIEYLKKFLYNLNTDIQNFFSKIGLISHFFDKINNIEKKLFNNVKILKQEIEKLKEQLKISFNLIEDLIKFKKKFYNLRVVAHIEVNRFGIMDLFSLTDSMDLTYNNLSDLVDKILDFINLWQELAYEMENIISVSYNSILGYYNSEIKQEFDEVKDKNLDIDSSLQKLKELFYKKDYLGLLKEYKSQLLNALEKIEVMFQKEFEEVNSKLSYDDLHKDEFKRGYDSLYVTTIKNLDAEEPSIELF